MTEQVHTVTDVPKRRRFRRPSKKTVIKAAALTFFGGCVALVGVDKLAHRKTRLDIDVDVTTEPTES